MDDWKLIIKKGVPELYDLSQDIYEDHNIANYHPDIVAKMVDIALSQHIPNEHFNVTLPKR